MAEDKWKIRTVRLDDEVWRAVKAMDCSLNQYLRTMLLSPGAVPSPLVSNLLPCRHCGEDGKISAKTSPWRACGSCEQDGHSTFAECRRCVEIAHAKKMAASSTGVDDPSVNYDWKDPA